MIQYIALLAITTSCARCHNSVDTNWLKAIPLAAKRAKLPPEKEAMRWIIQHESDGTPSRHLQNRRSTAYGLGQFLNSTWKSVGIKKTSCTVCQIEAIYLYCHYKYKSMANAVRIWKKRRSY